MTDVAIVLAVIALCLIATLSWSMETHRREREEWDEERKRLVDRAIARHAGEVIAFDRQGKAKPPREDTQDLFIEGLS